VRSADAAGRRLAPAPGWLSPLRDGARRATINAITNDPDDWIGEVFADPAGAHRVAPGRPAAVVKPRADPRNLLLGWLHAVDVGR
jgi:hypothetical protein